MKSILIAIILAPCVLLASCEHKCQPVLESCCPAKSVSSPLVEYDGHLWKVIMMEHHPDCGCDEQKEYEWLEDKKDNSEPDICTQLLENMRAYGLIKYDDSPHEKEPAYY